MSIEWSLAAVHDVVADAVPDREMVVSTTTRRTYGDAASRTRGLAAFLSSHGIGLRRERDELARWESGQDAVALIQGNGPEYLESMLGCFRARAVPFNVNHHYTPAEMRQLLDMIGPRAVIYQRALGPLVEAALGDRRPLLVHVEDGSSVPLPAGSTAFEVAAATPVPDDMPVPSPDDLYMVCTGGTTGSPKAVLWRQGDIFVAGMAGSDDATEESLRAGTGHRGGAWFPTPPLMHAAAQWTAFSGMHSGGTIVVHDSPTSFDAATILSLSEREHVVVMSIVGDAFARPIVEELRRRSYDLSALRTIGTGGAATSEHLKEALFELLPDVMIIDGYGASETGGMAFGPRTREMRQEGFAPGAGAAVLAADRSRFLEPGDDEIGWIARRGRVPLGYLGDRERTEATFPIVDGGRVSVPGDRGRLMAHGSIELLGRDSMVINSGGEKVFVEEVEAVVRSHDDVVDALVVGRPSERFGQEVVAVVQLRAGATLEPTDLREFVAGALARFKAPRAVVVCDRVARLANGKADYRWAATVALDAVDATGPPT